MIFFRKKKDSSALIEHYFSALAMKLEFDASGKLININIGNQKESTQIYATTTLKNFFIKENISHRQEANQIEFKKTLINRQNKVCRLIERFIAKEKSVRWEIEIESNDSAWTTDIITELKYPVSSKSRFWTTWSDPEQKKSGWRDPRMLKPFSNRVWEYSNLTKNTPENGNFFSIPLATFAELDIDLAHSILLSPEDSIFNMYLSTRKSGEILFVRKGHRLGEGKKVSFAMDIVSHEADWRGGLRFYVERYPHFFNPINPIADSMAGCGAYSGYEGAIDAKRLKKMGFSVNWKLSDDFPWMGMFIPPVDSPEETWTRSCNEPSPDGKNPNTSCKQMNDYAKRMKEEGFYVLSYFNVTEFGKNMNASEWKKHFSGKEIWKNPVQFLKERMPNAVLDPKLRTFYGAKITDCGDKEYQEFLIEQADRNIRLLPDTSGVCIDRMDWLRYFNSNANDGVSMINNRPVRALVESWKSFMKRLDLLMHINEKVIFVNPMTMRIDLFQYVDGFYSEHGESGPGLNSLAFVGMRKTAITWTCMWWYFPEYKLKPDPDRFFQRHLLMGVFPTAPFPFNNHALRPHPKTDQYYLDYGPLLKTLRGKKWVLAPRCIETTTKDVKVNLFETVNGFIAPITFGFGSTNAIVIIRNISSLKKMRVTAFFPGIEDSISPLVEWNDDVLVIDVPLLRGCAVLKLE